MNIFVHDTIALHWREDGNSDGAPVVFANSLGTDMRLWDQVIPRLPQNLRLIRFDKRGHGLSGVTDDPSSMGDLVHDTAALMDHLKVKDALFVGLSIGGIIAQGLAAERPDLIRAMVLSNTAAKIGTPDMWQDRIDAIRKGGIEALADPIIERWFSRAFRASDEIHGWRNMLTRTTVAGYIGCSAAIAETDLLESTSRLRLPTLGIAGTEDGSTPVDLVRETTDLVPGSRFELVRGAGHLPCVENPDRYAEILNSFIAATGHAL